MISILKLSGVTSCRFSSCFYLALPFPFNLADGIGLLFLGLIMKEYFIHA